MLISKQDVIVNKILRKRTTNVNVLLILPIISWIINVYAINLLFMIRICIPVVVMVMLILMVMIRYVLNVVFFVIVVIIQELDLAIKWMDCFMDYYLLL